MKTEVCDCLRIIFFSPSKLPLWSPTRQLLLFTKNDDDKRNIKADESDRLTKCHFHCSLLKGEASILFRSVLKTARDVFRCPYELVSIVIVLRQT